MTRQPRQMARAEAISELATAYGALRHIGYASRGPLGAFAEAFADGIADACGHDDLVAAMSPTESLSSIASRVERRIVRRLREAEEATR